MDRHRVLIVGVGSIGERHLRCFQATGRTDVGVIEINDTLRQTITSRYVLTHSYATLEAARDFAPTAAVIATPAPFHVPQARVLADQGVHLLIEKPLSITLDGVEDLLSLVQSRQIVAGLAYVYRSHPLLSQMRERIRSGAIGRPVEMVVVSGQHFPTYRPAYRTIYYTDRKMGGGAIQDALTHLINAGEWLLGPIHRLIADAEHLVLEGVTVEDTVHLLARHGNILASYALNQHQAPNETTITVLGDLGTLRAEMHSMRLLGMHQPGGDWEITTWPILERDTLFIAQANAFLDAIEGKSVFPCSLVEGVQTLRVNLAALQSLETQSWQTIPDTTTN